MNDVRIGKRIVFPILKQKPQIELSLPVIESICRQRRNWIDLCRIPKLVPEDHRKGVIVQAELIGQLFLELLTGHVWIWFLQKVANIWLRVDLESLLSIRLNRPPQVLSNQFPDCFDLRVDAGPHDIRLIDLPIPGIKSIPVFRHHLDPGPLHFPISEPV